MYERVHKKVPVKDVTVRKDSHVEIWLKNFVKPADLLVSEKGVRHPHLVRVSHGQVADFIWNKKGTNEEEMQSEDN